MSLYHEAANILTTADKEKTSLKSLVYGKKTWKSDPKALYALAAEAAKWSVVLSEVVERSGVLKAEKSLTPILALLLAHDLFLAKKGIALPATHGLNAAISRHKVRISAELTKARLRRGLSTLDALRQHVNSEAVNGLDSARHPRWIRINSLKTTLDDELAHSFSNYSQVRTIQLLLSSAADVRVYYVDENVPNLLAIAGPDNVTTFKSYKQGRLLLQEKASCFPAYLLDPAPGAGDVIDACAAPGNKTTHLAAILSHGTSKVTACEKDEARSSTLEKMIKVASADEIVTIKQKQDFLKLDPTSREHACVTSLLLDPSCSGSGIVGRDEATIKVHLPSANAQDLQPAGKKRKRGAQDPPPAEEAETTAEETPDPALSNDARFQTRVQNLSTFQLRILQHAMSFPAARRITYSTCSVHDAENENVVVRALLSDVAEERGWRVLRRVDQVEGMKKWHLRGGEDGVRETLAKVDGRAARKTRLNIAEVADACIRCEKGGVDGTMGFFVCGFVREDDVSGNLDSTASDTAVDHERSAPTMFVTKRHSEEDEWTGFSDEET